MVLVSSRMADAPQKERFHMETQQVTKTKHNLNWLVYRPKQINYGNKLCYEKGI